MLENKKTFKNSTKNIWTYKISANMLFFKIHIKFILESSVEKITA